MQRTESGDFFYDPCNEDPDTQDHEKKRVVRSIWPRNPEGAVIPPGDEDFKGKETSNGIAIWGASKYDFYFYYRIPNAFGLGPAVGSGSQLANWMKKHGELEWAKFGLLWAKEEESPTEIHPCYVGRLILTQESLHRRMPNPRTVSYPITPFDFQKYPHPWPFIPFTSPVKHRLQKRISFYDLPRRIIVHDPWGLLHVRCNKQHEKKEWMEMEPNVQIYHLRVNPERKRTKDDKPEKPKSFVLWPVFHEKTGPTSAPLCINPIYLPPDLPKCTDARLYLSPTDSIGEGNHSIVYRAQWELPRSLLVDRTLCGSCLLESIKHELENGNVEEKDVTLGEISVYTHENSENPRKPKPLTEWEVKEGTFTVRERYVPGIVMQFDSKEIPDEKAKLAKTYREQRYTGRVQCISPKVRWQSPDEAAYCSHILESKSFRHVPPTCRVSVAAKLSVPGDKHLAREADNYESFPSHFFEHWNGFNIMPPLRDPVPVGAVVPQFYGYYEPQMDEGEEYLSPILLLEDCGVQIRPNRLGPDDRQECASLLYRFHLAGWNHGSVATRNILRQPGPVSEYPLFRMGQNISSFRLIDFGRSTNIETDFKTEHGEKRSIQELLSL